jgi:oligoribonuclease NrnB/cAMP/cGMP phosphodiesterase (DHH superfamily)
VQKVCFYHAGCPDGFGAAWALWKAWGDRGQYLPRGHDDELDVRKYEDCQVVFVDIAPPNHILRGLAELCAEVVVLDHHVSSRNRFESDPDLARSVRERGHRVLFDLEQSGAALAWRHMHGEETLPDLLRYVQDQDLWSWKLPRSEEVNAAIASYSRRFEVWSELASRPVEELAEEGAPIVRANRMEVERVLTNAHPISVGHRKVEAVNATHARSAVGHELARRAAFGEPWGCVYRVAPRRVDASLYSIGELDVSRIAGEFGGGGHRNAAGFSVPLEVWLRDFV